MRSPTTFSTFFIRVKQRPQKIFRCSNTTTRTTSTSITLAKIADYLQEVSFSNNYSWANTPNRDGNDEYHVQFARCLQPFFQAKQPVVIRNAVSQAPATHLWKSWDYWKSKINNINDDDYNQQNNDFFCYGHVEIGGSYSSTNTERAEIPLSAYISYLELFEEKYGRNGPKEYFISRRQQEDNPSLARKEPVLLQPKKEDLVYMAQNDLFSFLHDDVITPKFCDDESFANNCNVGLGRIYSVMLWLGCRECSSPLHYDPLDNLLMQHVGRKVIWLYQPIPKLNDYNINQNGNTQEYVDYFYAGYKGQLSNTSPINPEKEARVIAKHDANEDDDDSSDAEFPLWRDYAPSAKVCVLEPGDVLYIPSKWWHYVRSLDTSASVNVWWR